MIRLILFVIIFSSFQHEALAKAYHKPTKWIKQGEFTMDLIQDTRGVSVSRVSKLRKQDASVVDLINCSYFWTTSGRYWPVGLVRASGRDRTTFLMPLRGYAYFDGNRFHLSWKLPPKESRVAFQGHLIIMNGKRVNRNGGFNSYHWRRECARSLIAIRRDKFGIEYVGIIRAYGSLPSISKKLIARERVIAAVNLDGGSSASRSKRVVNVLIIKTLDKRVVKLRKIFNLS